MRHEHLVVTVEADLKERIDADLDAGESLEAWVADAVERKLDRQAAGSDSTDSDSADSADLIDLGEANSQGSDSASPDNSDRGRIESGDETGRDESDDEYDEGFEYVDDCGI